MSIDLYYSPTSAPCRAVLLLGKTLGIDFNLKRIGILNGDQLKPEFIKINYQHTIPTIVDKDFTLWESRAILQYFVEKYGKDDSLYPKDPQKRARVNKQLYFDMGTLYQRLGEYFYKPFFNKTPFDPENYKKMEEAVGFLNKSLEGQKFAAGDTLTIADFALVSTISTYEATKFDLTAYPNVIQWFERCKKTMAEYKVNQEGVDELIEKVGSMLEKLKN